MENQINDFEQGIDAAVCRKSTGKIYFFKGSQYIRFSKLSDGVDKGYPKPIAGNWKGLPADFEKGIDAAVCRKSTGKIYFFKSSQYIRFSKLSDGVDKGYPKLLSLSNGIPAALTFDDGPTEWTEQILTKLAYYNREMGVTVRATFFVCGKSINTDINKQIIIRANREGHLIANHSFSHPHFSNCSKQKMIDEITETNKHIIDLGVPAPKYFRAPYGDLGKDENVLLDVLKELDMTLVKWNVSSHDWAMYDPIKYPQWDSKQKIIKGVFEKLDGKENLNLLFHDGGGTRQKTVDMVDSIVPALLGLGYKFVAVDHIIP